MWHQIDSNLKKAKDAFSEIKKLGAGKAKAEGVKGQWGKEVQSCLASCVALGVAVSGVKKAVEGWDGKDRKGLGIKVEVPKSETGGRYNEGWVVVKVSKA